jgi:hypothetical protein
MADAADLPSWHTVSNRLTDEILNWLDPRAPSFRPDEILPFQPAEDELGVVVSWMLHECRFEGEDRVVDVFLRERGHTLDARQRKWLEANTRSWLSAWQVTEVQHGVGFTAIDRLTGVVRTVEDEAASEGVFPSVFVLARIVDIDGLSLLAGTHPQPVPPDFGAEVVEKVCRARGVEPGAMSVAQARGPGVAEELLERWQHFVEAMFARMQPQIENLDGDPLLWTRDHFALDPARRAEVIARLLALERAETDEDGTTTHVTLFEPRYEMPSRFGPAMVARVVVKDSALVIETNSVRRADAARARVEEALKAHGLGEAVRHRLRDHEDIAVQAEPPFVIPELAANQTPADLFREFERSHWRSWIDTPLPMLRGISPREASKTKTGRVMLVRFLEEMEREEAASPRGDTSDFDMVRRVLGV